MRSRRLTIGTTRTAARTLLAVAGAWLGLAWPSVGQAGAPAGRTITVRNAAELVEAIGSHRVIEVMPGLYELTAAATRANKNVRWAQAHDGPELVIEKVTDLTIRAAKSQRPRILASPRYAFVMRFVKTANVELRDLVLGHTEEGYCQGGVVAVEKSTGFRIVNSELYGSGTVGVHLEKVADFLMEGSAIRGCTYGIASIEKCANVRFLRSRFDGNGVFDLVEVTKSKDVLFRECSFSDNATNDGSGDVFFATDSASSVVLDTCSFTNNKFDQLTNEPKRLVLRGPADSQRKIRALLERPDPQFNQIYEVTGYKHWIVTASQAGVAFWNPATGKVERLVKAHLATSLMVRGEVLWVGAYRHLLRFDGTNGKKALSSKGTGGSRLIQGPGGELIAHLRKLVQIPNKWWRHRPAKDAFEPLAVAGERKLPALLGGAEVWSVADVLARRNGEVWVVDFMSGLWRHKSGLNERLLAGSREYPGKDPRSLYEAPDGTLWVADFGTGFYRYDDTVGTFTREPTVKDKGSAVVVDAARGRTWLLHYTDDLHLLEEGQPPQRFDLRHLKYKRDLYLAPNGDVWVGGYTALVRLSKQTGEWTPTGFVVESSSLGPGAL